MKNSLIGEEGNKALQFCPFCNRQIYGIGPLKRHVKACKKKLCAQCTRPSNLCMSGMKEWYCECGETFTKK